LVHNISWLGDLKFKSEWNGLEIYSHGTEDLKGLEAMSPGMIFVSSLGLCTASRIIGTCKKKGWKVEGLKIELSPKINWNEWRAEEYSLDISLKADLTEDERKELLEEAHGCFVHRSIMCTPKVNLDIKYE
jgi:uncharacterized OsmC-like protein